jgi:anaerobic magnesium-protoporphyrin IX monomethyl ester cyclase
MKILLINPPVISVSEPWFDEPDFVRTSIAFLAGYLKKYSNHEIFCLDAKFEKLRFADVIEKCRFLKPDLIGLTAFTNEIKPAAYLAGLIKKDWPQIYTVIGGAHITALPEQTMNEFPTFDIGVFGEGEETFLELCNALENNTPLEGINGVVHRNGSFIKKNNERQRILDQDSIPIPAWELMPPSRTYYIQTVRGCPFNCVFCLNHNGKVARKRSLNLVIEEMLFLIKLGAKRISFGDELFSVDMKRTYNLMELMIEHKIGEKVLWDIQTHVGYVNDELLAKMKEANIYRCEMGIEAGDEDVLRRMGKATNPDMIYKAFDLARKYRITTGSFLLIGQPNETVESIWKTIKIGIRVNPSEPIIGTMVPYPGTEVARMAASGEGGYRLITSDWDNYSKQINGALEFNGISKRKLEFFQILGYTLIFLLNGRILDFLRFFWKYKTAGIALFKKVLFNKVDPEKNLKPVDYEAIINSKANISSTAIIDARTYWKNVQEEEIKNAKQKMPHLLKEQMPLKKIL